MPMTKRVKMHNKFSQHIKLLNLNTDMTYKLCILHLGHNCLNLDNISLISDKLRCSSHQQSVDLNLPNI